MPDVLDIVVKLVSVPAGIIAILAGIKVLRAPLDGKSQSDANEETKD